MQLLTQRTRILLFWAFSAITLVGTTVSSAFGEGADVADEPQGSLVLIGGALRVDQAEVWNEVVRLAGGPGAKIAVVPAASGDPMRVGGRTIETLNRHGADAFLVPVAMRRIEVDYRQAVQDLELAAKVRGAGGVFFTGGAQSLITRALYTEDGGNTPLLDAIWQVYRRGGVIAGTSAGAAVMSRVMFSEPGTVLSTIQRGVRMGKEIDTGCGFMHPDWFVEQHCLVRGRFARMVVAMRSANMKYGVGIDENTAVVVRPGHLAEVIGYKGAVVLDLSEADEDQMVDGFNIRNAKVTYLDRGDSIDLATCEVKPSQSKRDGQKIVPTGVDFMPEHDEDIMTHDILGNTAMVDVICRLIHNKSDEAIGFALDRGKSKSADAPNNDGTAYEFRFYRDKDTVGWFTDVNGAADYTVSNVRLDIRPVNLTTRDFATSSDTINASVLR